MSSAAETLHRARAAGVRVSRNIDRLALKSPSEPAPELLLDLAKHKAAILDLLRNPVCQQCDAGDGMQGLQHGVWLHAECAAYRHRAGIPWNATPDDLIRMTVLEVTVAAAVARLEENMRKQS